MIAPTDWVSVMAMLPLVDLEMDHLNHLSRRDAGGLLGWPGPGNAVPRCGWPGAIGATCAVRIRAGFPSYRWLYGPQLETDRRITVGWQHALQLFGG